MKKITPETLMVLSDQWANSQDFRLQNRAKDAIECAGALDKRGLAEVRSIGPFPLDLGLYSPGQKVRIKKGAVVRTMHPSYPDGKQYQRSTVVVVDRVEKGWVDYYHPQDPVIHDPRIVFAGVGGYWCYADLNDVEIIDR